MVHDGRVRGERAVVDDLTQIGRLGIAILHGERDVFGRLRSEVRVVDLRPAGFLAHSFGDGNEALRD